MALLMPKMSINAQKEQICRSAGTPVIGRNYWSSCEIWQIDYESGLELAKGSRGLEGRSQANDLD